MIMLYQFATSPFTEKVRRALNYLQIPFDVHEVARAKVPEGTYQEVSPTGKFPAIRDGDDVIWDSTDIIYHVNNKASNGKSLVPASGRDAALAHALEEWADESLYFYEMTMRLTWAHNLESALDEFAESMPGVPRDNLKNLIQKSVTQMTQAQGVGRKPREQVLNDVERHFTALEQLLEGREWLVGDDLSFADLAVISQVNAMLYASEARASIENKSSVLAWLERVDQIAPL
ncbi:MAG: glutathione S-transferase family protein [Pseudomonadales bacterium]